MALSKLLLGAALIHGNPGSSAGTGRHSGPWGRWWPGAGDLVRVLRMAWVWCDLSVDQWLVVAWGWHQSFWPAVLRRCINSLSAGYKISFILKTLFLIEFDNPNHLHIHWNLNFAVFIWVCLDDNIKTILSTYGDFHVKDKTAVRTSYL